MSDFDQFNLVPSINSALKEKGYTKPTPIQALSIPHLLKRKDLLGIAQTGTGKTAAFSLPIINHLATSAFKIRGKRTRVLILTPTRELAAQIDENIRSYSKGLGLKTKVIFGGVGATPQIKALSRGLDIVVATPGRLLDLMNQSHVIFDELDTFVLDEADRMLDMGFIHDIKKIIAKLPIKKQTLLFSATMPKDIEKLANSLLNNPEKVEITPESTTVEKISQSVNILTKENKVKLLADILSKDDMGSALVFTRTKRGADQVVKKLAQVSIKAAAIHGNKSQNNRELALKKFRSGELKVLVATDIAARGIDVDHITHVINYNLPEDPSNYVHRIGRTGRAGREGVAISFSDAVELNYLKLIEKHIRQKIAVNLSQPYHADLVPEAKPAKKQMPKRFNRPKQQAKTGNAGGQKKVAKKKPYVGNKTRKKGSDHRKQ